MSNPRLNALGEEVLDPTPITRALRFSRPVSTLDEMRRMLRIAREEAAAQGFETPEEANDFDIDEEPAPVAPFAVNLDNIPLEVVTRSESPSVEAGSGGSGGTAAAVPSVDAGGTGAGPVDGVSA